MILKKINEEFNSQDNEYFACVMRHNFKDEDSKDRYRKSVVVVLNPSNPSSKITKAVIVHECIHIKNIVFDIVGYKCKRNNDEHEAYFTEFIFNIVEAYYDKIIKKEKKMAKEANKGVEDKVPELGTAQMNSSTREELTVPIGRLASGKTLRREYIYKRRDEYIINNQEIPNETMMDTYAEQAKTLYPQEGDYSVEGTIITWLGYK